MGYPRWEALRGIKEVRALGGQRTRGGLRPHQRARSRGRERGDRDRKMMCMLVQTGKMAGVGWADTERQNTLQFQCGQSQS